MQLATSLNTRALPRLRQRALRYTLIRTLLRLGASLSTGIAVGYQHGFDSAVMLDYVYQNQPSGAGWLGRWFDRVFLNQVGWRACRTRKALVQELLTAHVRARHAQGLAIHILDAASGPGRYVLEVVADARGSDVHLTCWDTDAAALWQGQRLASELQLRTRVRFECADATSLADLAQITPLPDIVLVSGLYEILIDDAAVCRSLLGIRQILAPGGVFLFTSQVAHPQLELIANVLTNRRGEPWIMCTRPLSRLERWAREAGFSLVTSQVEPYGIFGVTQCMVSDSLR